MASPIEYLHGVSAIRGDLLRKELNIFSFNDLLEHFPLRHIDKTRIDKISSLSPSSDYAQITGRLTRYEIVGEKRSKRLVAQLDDGTGIMELVWFQGISWVIKSLSLGNNYRVFGKLGWFLRKPQMAHPELELIQHGTAKPQNFLEPVYPTTEKLRSKGLDGKGISALMKKLFEKLVPDNLPECLPPSIIEKYKFISRFAAFNQVHFPINEPAYRQAVRRLKFEELFLSQLTIQRLKLNRIRTSKGMVFVNVGPLFNRFYNQGLPFELTSAQKKVIKEIRKDLGSGKQMNRLLQGDVGSGKTMVALLSMLLAADNGYQSVMMAPTEVLANQHYASLIKYLDTLPVKLALLTGSTKGKERKEILTGCESGEVNILIGTHAVIEDKVNFNNLGLAVIDEQHKFGVAQRARLWKKNKFPPHNLVMTATPIPRTLALTAFGDLDYSIIDELPPGRRPVQTVHRFEQSRPQVMDFIKEEIKKGRQVYIVYPLIEESSKLDYENLMKGYEEVKSFFPEPKYWISMVHGKQDALQKETNMRRFIEGDTQIMVSTTVIEVGVNVPNATVMVIESAEKFGLSQLHQLRGRVGRGADQSYCILLTGNKLSKDAKQRLAIMTNTQDGFVIAEKDLELRGPGEMEGTRQSGAVLFKLANIVADRAMLEAASQSAEKIIQNDPGLIQEDNLPLKNFLAGFREKTAWGRIA
ncbi:MAG: ATP-dependent DNA helicase RecG [Chitinophagaceae bacterium]|nr:ATP-dependent DNA helicase RecG [Chitinophagaceae bacterium]